MDTPPKDGPGRLARTTSRTAGMGCTDRSAAAVHPSGSGRMPAGSCAPAGPLLAEDPAPGAALQMSRPFCSSLPATHNRNVPLC